MKLKWTYKDIFNEYGITVTACKQRVKKLKLKGIVKNRDSTIYFECWQAAQIVEYLDVIFENHCRKIEIIERYIKGEKGRDISSEMKISTKYAYDAIREYNEKDCIIVESSMNYLFI